MDYDEYRRKRRQFEGLISQINLTHQLVIDAKEKGASRIPVSEIADPIADTLRDLRDSLGRLSNEKAEEYRQFLTAHSTREYDERYRVENLFD